MENQFSTLSSDFSSVIPPFCAKVSGLNLERRPLKTLQINLGKLCNQACLHCHVEAGPKRPEIMPWSVMAQILVLLENQPEVETVDLTGGAPEMNPNFRQFVVALREMGKEVIDRCNLTILFEPGQEETAQFLASQRVQVVASLPCYSKDNVDRQRGRGVFDKSIEGLRLLNGLGYGQPDSDLLLNLVYNPGGAFLPPSQQKLEVDYKRELKELFGIRFNQLFALANMPIRRFLWDLQRQGKEQEYMNLLLQNFNSEAAKGVMCRDLLSVGWDGQLFDCDFNQMLELPVKGQAKTVFELESLSQIHNQDIVFGNHCYGCTAGAGSSCGGALD
ncbi:MAG: arsenosugar biosynthesis radical SAM protein ArsS [Bdellovibrionales bacterium]|nr:arsenosugar biosynthesis radical SAM protein ArsS [Bdellovibrionales bacterium]